MQLKNVPYIPEEQIIPWEVPGKLWEVIEADILQVTEKCSLCIINYLNKLHISR